MSQRYEVQVWSHPDYDGLVAEVVCEEGVVAIVSEPSVVGAEYVVEVFPPPAGQRAWRLEAAALTSALGDAVAQLKWLARG